MSTRPATSFGESNTRSAHLAVPDAPVRLVTVIVGIVVALTFLFGFGNVTTLGIRLGVPTYIAFLVAPAVDLSVVGLLLGTQHLARHGGPAEVLRSARRLLIFSSTVTLALNIAEPLIAGHYGKAAFDAVGPLLLIGWAEVAPSLLQAMQTASSTADPIRASPESRPDEPTRNPISQRQPSERRKAADPESRRAVREARQQDLLHRARAEDVLHWQHHQRPISAESLRKRLHVGAGAARTLVARLRSDTHIKLDSQPPEAAEP